MQCGGKMITRDMTIGEIVRMYPQTLDVFTRFGLDCFECQVAEFEKLEHGAGVHKVDVEKLLGELNRAVSGAD
jgi:hybrid cluster-associated redox disulfide protein